MLQDLFRDEADEEGGRLLGKSRGRARGLLRRPVAGGRFMLLMTLCCAAAMMLAGFAVSRWSEHYPSLQVPQHTGIAGPVAGDGADTSTHSAARIAPSTDFDLTRTGFVVGAAPQHREYVFHVDQQLGAPDGVEKPMITINGQSPGPLIEANIGDSIRVIVHNKMADRRTTMHWHGIDQRNSSWMDGVDGVSQCGIPPGESFAYEFNVTGQRGTFWYHSHVASQYTDGLFGPLIIHDPNEMVPDVDEERIVMVGDLYHQPSQVLLGNYLGIPTSPSPSSRSSPSSRRRHAAAMGMEPSPDNFLMNGRNIFNCSGPRAPRRHPYGEFTLGQCASGSVYSTRVDTGHHVRLRLISHSSNIPLWFSVDSHVLQIVEIDGVEIAPLKTTRVLLGAGQRYSVILAADQPQAGNYIMRATAASEACTMVRFADAKLKSVGYEATGILSYAGTDGRDPALGQPWDLSSEEHPDFGPEPWAGRLCEDLPFDMAKPMRSEDAYAVGEDNSHHIPFAMKPAGVALLTYIDGTVFKPPNDTAVVWQASEQRYQQEDPTLISDAVSPYWHFRPNEHVYVSPDSGAAVEIALSAINMMTHPWHLHGQTFQIVGWGAGVFGSGNTVWNFDNPLRRDTVTLPGKSHIVLRVKADNPGIWALHCHIQWHAEGGMFALLAHQLDTLQQQIGTLNGDIRDKFCPSPRG